MGKLILGSDISRNNSTESVIRGLDFYVLKATEGATHCDTKMELLMLECTADGIMPVFGFYHFARPDNGNTPDSEVKNYMKKIDAHVGQCFYALDWEAGALTVKDGDQWAEAWLKGVYNITGSRPFFYASASWLSEKLNDSKWRFLKNYPLWVAHYGAAGKYSELKKDGNMWQFTSSPLDLDLYYGTRLDLIRTALGA